MAKTKYLVETSAVRPALGSSTTAHNRHFADQMAGGKLWTSTYNHLLDDLRAFYESFLTPVTDCEVNAFLQLGKPRGRTAVLLEDARVRQLSVGRSLADLAEHKAWVTCKECCTIGDPIIALEQPPSLHLVHLDGSFNELCEVRGRPHKQIKSVKAVESES